MWCEVQRDVQLLCSPVCGLWVFVSTECKSIGECSPLDLDCNITVVISYCVRGPFESTMATCHSNGWNEQENPLD